MKAAVDSCKLLTVLDAKTKLDLFLGTEKQQFYGVLLEDIEPRGRQHNAFFISTTFGVTNREIGWRAEEAPAAIS